jgi:hypothetical protein
MPRFIRLAAAAENGQLANDRILDAEGIDLVIRLGFWLRDRSLRAWSGISRRCVLFHDLPWQRPSCELVLQQVEQAVESRIRECNLRRTGYRNQIKRTGPDEVKSLDLV